MHFLVDECLSRHMAERLRLDGHDVVWARNVCPGNDDRLVLDRANAEGRIVITEDRDFGDLTIRLRLHAIGIIIVAVGEFDTTLDEIAIHVAQCIGKLGDTCKNTLTVIEPGRIRQRPINLS